MFAYKHNITSATAFFNTFLLKEYHIFRYFFVSVAKKRFDRFFVGKQKEGGTSNIFDQNSPSFNIDMLS